MSVYVKRRAKLTLCATGERIAIEYSIKIGRVVDKLIDILITLLSVGLFFKYPRLIPISILVVASGSAFWFYRWKYTPQAGVGPWREVLAVWAIVALVLSIVGVLGYRYWGLPSPFADDDIGILVAEVPDQTNREQQTAYQTAILRRVQSNEQLRERVKVKLITRPLLPDADDQQAEAVKIGRRLRAAFVVRPFVVLEGAQQSQQPWLTVVNPQEVFRPLASLGEFPSTELATPDKLPLPENLTQLAEVIFALALNARHAYKEAAQVAVSRSKWELKKGMAVGLARFS
jgi:hypothetical protein